MSLSDFPLNWLLTFFVLGWVLGWLVLRDGRLAVFPALFTALLFLLGGNGRLGDVLGNPSQPSVFIVPILFLAFALWAVTRLSLPVVWRMVFSSVLVPLLVMAVVFAVVLWFLKQIP